MFISINGCRIFFDVYGSQLNVTEDTVIEKPTLLILHGGHGLADHTLYVEFFSQFSDIVQVIFWDQRGCGRSDTRDASEWNLAQWGEDVYLFCQALGLQKPIILGMSTGGHVLCEYIRHHPEHPGALIFCNTEAQFILEDVCQAMEARAGKEVAELTRLQFIAPTPDITQAYMNKVVPYYAKKPESPAELNRCRKNPPVFNHYCLNEMKRFNYVTDMAKVQCPSLFMVGGDSPYHLPMWAKEMADNIPSDLVQWEVFENCGAPVYKDNPEKSFNILRKFLLDIASKNQSNWQKVFR